MADRTRIDDVAVSLDGARVPATTVVASGGPYVVTFSTIVPAHGIELHSTYTGHLRAERTVVTWLFLAPGGSPHEIETAELDPGEMPVYVARRRCLFDHLVRLQELIAGELGVDVRIDTPDRALIAAEH